jgi:uncharacterized protein YgiM (DUF1202 family)
LTRQGRSRAYESTKEEFVNRIVCASALCTFLVIGYVLLTFSGSAFAQSIGKDRVNIRSGPSLKSRIIYQAPLGYPVKIEKEKGDWVFFRDWENMTGWVYKPLVSDIETAVILVKIANVRSSAGRRHKVVTKVKRGEIYKVLAKNGNWVHLGYYFDDDPLGWVRSDLVFGN